MKIVLQTENKEILKEFSFQSKTATKEESKIFVDSMKKFLGERVSSCVVSFQKEVSLQDCFFDFYETLEQEVDNSTVTFIIKNK